MNWKSISFGLAVLSTCGCQTQAQYQLSAGCTPFPSEISGQKGSPMASTSFSGSVQHAAPTHHIAVPNRVTDDVRIVLERSACFGTCPSYRVEIQGNGKVLFHGDRFVTFSGDHEFRISVSTTKCLLDDFHIADFWSLDSDYVAPVTDIPQYKVSLSIGGQNKTLTDYAGQMVGMPPIVSALEQAIDQAARTGAWITGDADTIANLESEHFNFHSRKAADILATAVKDAPDEVIIGLMDRGVSLDGLSNEGMGGERHSAVETAAMYGRLGLLRRFISAGAFTSGGQRLVSATLRASVASERVDVVSEVLKYGPDINSPDKFGDTALALIFTGAHPHGGDENAPHENASIIHILGKAGANANLLNSEHETILKSAYLKEDKRALLAIGAIR